VADSSADSSRGELLAEIEGALGRPLRTRAEVRAYLDELKARRAPPRPADRRWAIARHASLAVGLLIAVLQYYLIDIYVQIFAMQRVQFLTPETAPVLRKSALEVLRFFS
jgi:hypothetical protein